MKTSLIITLVAIWIALFMNMLLAKPTQPLFSADSAKVAQSEVIQQAEESNEMENAAEVKEMMQAEFEIDADENVAVN